MKPVAIFRHFPTEGPGYFATFLGENRIPWRLVRIDAGEAVPVEPDAFSGLAFMGGPMSVNDPLLWIPQVLGLIRMAVARDIPVIGHCLGGQLMAKALGGAVTQNAVKEIGWHEIEIADGAAALQWFDGRHTLPVFHWHGDTFTVPDQATRLAGSAYCQNQVFALGKHLAMQCHIEMTRDLVESWCTTGSREIAASSGPAVQPVDEILRDLDARIAALNHLAAGIYRHWIAGVNP